jgi:hypothetical protein
VIWCAHGGGDDGRDVVGARVVGWRVSVRRVGWVRRPRCRYVKRKAGSRWLAAEPSAVARPRPGQPQPQPNQDLAFPPSSRIFSKEKTCWYCFFLSFFFCECLWEFTSVSCFPPKTFGSSLCLTF